MALLCEVNKQIVNILLVFKDDVHNIIMIYCHTVSTIWEMCFCLTDANLLVNISCCFHHIKTLKLAKDRHVKYYLVIVCHTVRKRANNRIISL